VEEDFSLDISPGEKAESQIDLMIARHHDQRVKDKGERAAKDYGEQYKIAGKRRESDEHCMLAAFESGVGPALSQELGDIP
jgi:hypothetical protein